MLNDLEATIQKIILHSATSMAHQIAHSVRQSLAAEIMGTGTAVSAPVIPKRRGRPPGSKSKAKPATASPNPAKARVARPGKAKRKSYKRRLISQSELDAVLNVVAKKPALTSVEIQKEAGIDAKQAGRVLGKLREIKKVKWKGERSRATYTVA